MNIEYNKTLPRDFFFLEGATRKGRSIYEWSCMKPTEKQSISLSV